MKRIWSSLLALAASVLLIPAVVAEDDGFQPLFNGKDLSGWANVNCAPDTFTVPGPRRIMPTPPAIQGQPVAPAQGW